MTLHMTHLLVRLPARQMRTTKRANTQNTDSRKCGQMLMDILCTACKSTRTAHGIHCMMNTNRTDYSAG